MTPQEEISKYFEVCGFNPDDRVSVVWKGRSGALGWTNVPVWEAWKPINGHQRVDCWISANPMHVPMTAEGTPDKESRGTSAEVYAVRALWADLDVGPGKLESFAAARAVIAEVSELIQTNPVVLVASGHGLQPRWRMEDWGDFSLEEQHQLVEQFGRLVQKVAAEHGGKADSVYDPPRIIRAPRTMNCKDGATKGIPVKIKFTDTLQRVDIVHLVGALEAYVPVEKPVEAVAKDENVDLSRGNAYVTSVIGYIREELTGIADWPVGQTDERGRGWEKIQADAAYRLAELAKADWNSLTEEQAQRTFVDFCPIDTGWTVRDVIKKWKSQWPRAEAAEPPATVDDPLAPGYEGGDASPRPAAPADDIWSTGADGEGDPGVSGGRAEGPADADQPAAAGPGDPRDSAADAPREWAKYTWDDFGNAERTVALHGALLRWSPLDDRWYGYADGAWRESRTGGERAVQDMVRRLPDLEARFYSTAEYRKGKNVTTDRLEFLDFTKACRSAARVRAAATVMKNDGELDVGPRAFDNDPMLLNVANGVVELRTGELLEHAPALMLHRQAPVAYDPDAKAPMWEAFIARAMPDELDRAYLQRIVGYSITGRTSEQAVFLHHGVTHNGKSVFLRVLEAMLGSFARVVPPTTLLMKRNEAHPTDIMGLEGRRLLQVSELPEGARLEEALVKRLSGEETITARGMGQDFRDFKIAGKIHIVTNPLPHIGDDAATKRRIHMVHWGVEIPVEERDPLLAERMIAQELPGVLAWAVRGALEWGKTGLQPPVETQMARDEYFASEDEFGMFINDELIVGAKSFTPTKELYRRYAQWCDGIRAKPMSVVAFGRKLSARGIEPSRTNSTRGFVVALTSPSWAALPPDPLA